MAFELKIKKQAGRRRGASDKIMVSLRNYRKQSSQVIEITVPEHVALKDSIFCVHFVQRFQKSHGH